MEYILLYPETHRHLGLFADLEDMPNVAMFSIELPELNNAFLHFLRRVHTSWTINRYIPLPFREKWYVKPEMNIERNKEYCVIVLDGAMKGLKSSTLNELFVKDNVRGVLVLINSLEASSIAILENRKKFEKANWDAVYTFDFGDAEKYGYKYLGNCYYSKHDMPLACEKFPDEETSDIYFAGGLKGNREDLIISVFEMMEQNGIRTNFNLSVSGTRRLEHNRYADQIRYQSGRWQPYDKILAGVSQTKVILEILQKGQNGPSLRYYEAVCCNKRLLTNNPAAVNLPYYDAGFIKVFHSAADIDYDWIKEDITGEYHYSGEFSPKYMLKRVLED
ncbi:MAG: hypothetical protein LUC90_07045 [Lachnospiraceae bacterium]|nr:hypothetical protein [Lachnospiraceae bacterium]